MNDLYLVQYVHCRCTVHVLEIAVHITLVHNMCIIIWNLMCTYTVLQAHHEVGGMESQMNSLYESADLFEVSVPEFKQLKACRRDIIMLKSLWDMIALVQSSFSDWNTTLWCDINVEQMDMDCKKFVKDIRGLDKEMRAWDAFTGEV